MVALFFGFLGFVLFVVAFLFGFLGFVLVVAFLFGSVLVLVVASLAVVGALE